MNKVRINDVIDLNTHLIGYVRRTPKGSNKTQIEGVFVGTLVDHTIKVGYSKLNVKAGDKFDLAFGINKARGRAIGTDVIDYAKVPQGKFRRKYAKFVNRCLNYYQGAEAHFDENTIKQVRSRVAVDNLGDCQVV